jgi:RNA polymerase sigma factor (sigma-70 family)
MTLAQGRPTDAQLLVREEPVLRRIISRYVHDPVVVDDIFQDVGVKVIRHLHTARDEAALRGWIYQIARNACLDWLRARGRRKDVRIEDINAFGAKEFRALSRWSGPHLRRRLSKVVPWRWAGCLPKKDYPILDDVSQVPRWVWERSDLIVERFIPERDGDDFVLRCWLFFGEQEYSVKLFSHHPVVKVGGIHRHEYLHEVPDSLREARRALGFDFGKFDYVMVDGQAVLLDANKTPTIAGNSRTPNLLRLATGLSGFVARGAA